MSMAITNRTNEPLTVQLGQVGVLYHEYLQPGETMRRNTGAVHLTIWFRQNHTGRDDTNVGVEGVLPVAGTALTALIFTATGPISLGVNVGVEVALPVAGTALSVGATGPVSLGVGAGVLAASFMANNVDNKYTASSSMGWYAGYNHQLEIHGGSNTPFSIKNTKNGQFYAC